jgi:two-component system sensor histidine kinase RpfC
MTDFVLRMRRVLGVYQKRVRDPDIEQAWLRIGICTLAFAYVWYLILSEGQLTNGLWMGLIASVGDCFIAAIMIWRLKSGRANVTRLRYLGIIADNSALTLGMAGAGEGGVAMIGVYLWVTIGNGFRFGPRYLLASYWLSIVGFGLQLALVPFWEHHRVVGAGLFLAGAIVPLYVLVLLIRLTGQKEAAEQLSNAKSRFVANVSHELRTPLTGVFAVYDLLRGRKLAAAELDLVSALGNAIRTLKSSVDAVLQMSKLEAGAERAERRRFNLWYFVHQLAATVKPQSVAKRLRWSVNIAPNVPYNVIGDPNHLTHVLGNLLNNAFKFTSAGGVKLSVAVRGEYIRFEVEDTGIGIPLGQQESLFERFVQVDGSAKRKFGGTGLGTSIARDLTELMGGNIGVVSTPGCGTTFSVELPLLRRDIEVEQADFSQSSRVLVFGKDSDARRAVVRELSGLGREFEVHDSRDLEAKICAPSENLAAFLVMDGPQAEAHCSAMLRDHAESVCPIVVLGCQIDSTYRKALMEFGVSAIIDGSPTAHDLEMILLHLVFRAEAHDYDTPAKRSITNATEVRALSLLIADDNVSNRMLIARILTEAGHQVAEAERGDAAFDLLASGQFDLALLDLNMPDMSGPDVIKLFRAASVGASHLPIIILSADATPAAKQESLDAGADEFLTKPVRSDALLSTIDRVMLQVDSRSSQLKSQHFAAIDRPKVSTSFQQLVDNEQVQSLRRIARGDEKFLQNYVGAAFDDLEKAVADLRVACCGNNLDNARAALHIIEGTAASLGALSLVRNCKSMRTTVAAPINAEREAALAELSTTLALTKSAVVAVLHDSPNQDRSRARSSQ